MCQGLSLPAVLRTFLSSSAFKHWHDGASTKLIDVFAITRIGDSAVICCRVGVSFGWCITVFVAECWVPEEIPGGTAMRN